MKSVNRNYVEVREYDPEKRDWKEDLNKVSVDEIARALNPEQFAQLLDDYCNNYHPHFERGLKIGRALWYTHRTGQRSIVAMLMGIIKGMSEQEFVDGRNEKAIALTKKVAILYQEEGIGLYI